jgi:hypothetical protein
MARASVEVATDRRPGGTLGLSARSIRILLYATPVLLGVASYGMHLITRAAGTATVATFDVGDEISLGTWFQTLQFVAAAVALVFVARTDATPGNLVRRVRFLALVMLVLSIDESVSLHERAGHVIQNLVETGGYLYYVWVVPALVVTFMIAVSQIGWLGSLPAATRHKVMLAGATFVLSAAGLEMLAGPEAEATEIDSLLLVSFIALEELGEMIGLSVFISAMLDLLAGRRLEVEVR